LSPKPNLEQLKSKIQDVDIIWISHEHPDHLHFPTLKWISENVDKKVDIYFQKTNSEKVFAALKKIGYSSFSSMAHMQKIPISSKVDIASYAHRHLDSALAVFVEGKFWLLNINDTELSTSDCSIITNKFGNPCVLYNQFSIAGSNGIELSLKNDATEILSIMVLQHKKLKAKLTVPFASFVRFARTDNAYMNPYTNTVFDVQNKFKQVGLNLCIQAYSCAALEWKDTDHLPLDWELINAEGVKEFTKVDFKNQDLYDYSIISVSELKKVIENKIKIWREVTNPIVWKLMNLQTITFRIKDWGDQVWEIDFKNCLFHEKKDTNDSDIEINSQPLFQTFKLPFGVQTLGVSGRYKFADKFQDVPSNWKKIRILSSLFNAEIYLSIRSLFSSKTLVWLWERRSGLFGQIIQQLKRFRSN
jgi:UDP-MurNAc hydroxylase